MMPQNPSNVPQPQTTKSVEGELQKYAAQNQFDLSLIPAHGHTGTDSLQVQMSDLVGKYASDSFVIPGTSASGTTNYSVFHIAAYSERVQQVQEVHAIAGTDGGSVTLQIEKLTATQIPGAGMNLLSTALSLKATANSVQTGIIVPLVATPNLAKGDRLAFKLSGTPTSVQDVVVSIVFGF